MENIIMIIVLVLFVLVYFVAESIKQKREYKKMLLALETDFTYGEKKNDSVERLQHISGYFRNHQSENCIDDITWNDLDMDRLFGELNHSNCAAGEEYLYYLLHDVQKSKEQLEHFENLTDAMLKETQKRVQLQVLLRKLGYTGKYSLYDYMNYLDTLGNRNNTKAYVIDALILLMICLIPFFTSIAVFGLVLLIIYNITTYFSVKKEIEPYFISFSYIIRLLEASEEIVKLDFKAIDAEKKQIKNLLTVMGNTIQSGGFWLFFVSSGNPVEVVIDYIRMTFHVDLILFNRMLVKVRNNIAEIDGLVTELGLLDAAIMNANFRASLTNGYCIPEFIDGKAIHIEDGYHPLLKEPVKNDVKVCQNVLITGSNASGKSTFLRMVAVNAILAQTLHTCSAKKVCMNRFMVISSMALRDSIEAGDSYYITEIKALRRIMDATMQNQTAILCFVDEVLRGTNTIERIAAACQILYSFRDQNVICFAATHDIELSYLLEKYYDNYHFEENISKDDISFTYKLCDGRTKTRNAIKLLELMGYQGSIIKQAEMMVENFEKTGIWKL